MKALYAYIIMTIQGTQQRPPHHDYKQTKTLPVSGPPGLGDKTNGDCV